MYVYMLLYVISRIPDARSEVLNLLALLFLKVQILTQVSTDLTPASQAPLD